MIKPIMTIIGFGPMGKHFARIFSPDFDVRVSSSRDVKNEAIETGASIASKRKFAISLSDYIFLAVPLTALPKLIDEVNLNAKKDAIVIDCCSARVPAEEILSRLNQRHFGIHDVKSGEFCITGNIDDEMMEFFRGRNIIINCISPEEHDRINAVIGLGHFLGLSLGKFLSKDQKDILSGMGSGSKLIALINQLAGNSPTTWRETQMDNQFTKEIREALIKELSEYHEDLSEGKYPY